jgi:hypothetical protein
MSSRILRDYTPDFLLLFLFPIQLFINEGALLDRRLRATLLDYLDEEALLSVGDRSSATSS